MGYSYIREQVDILLCPRFPLFIFHLWLTTKVAVSSDIYTTACKSHFYCGSEALDDSHFHTSHLVIYYSYPREADALKNIPNGPRRHQRMCLYVIDTHCYVNSASPAGGHCQRLRLCRDPSLAVGSTFAGVHILLWARYMLHGNMFTFDSKTISRKYYITNKHQKRAILFSKFLLNTSLNVLHRFGNFRLLCFKLTNAEGNPRNTHYILHARYAVYVTIITQNI